MLDATPSAAPGSNAQAATRPISGSPVSDPVCGSETTGTAPIASASSSVAGAQPNTTSGSPDEAALEAAQLAQVAQLAMGVKSLRALILNPGSLDLGVLGGHLDVLTGHVQNLGLALALASSVSRAAMEGTNTLVDEVASLRGVFDAARVKQRSPPSSGSGSVPPRAAPTGQRLQPYALSESRLQPSDADSSDTQIPRAVGPRRSIRDVRRSPPSNRAPLVCAPEPGPPIGHAGATTRRAAVLPSAQSRRPAHRSQESQHHDLESYDEARSPGGWSGSTAGDAAFAEPRDRDTGDARVIFAQAASPASVHNYPPRTKPATLDVLPERSRPSGAEAYSAAARNVPSELSAAGESQIARPRLSGLAKNDPAALRAVLLAAHAQLAQDRVDCESALASAASEARSAEERAANAELSAAHEALAGFISEATRNGVEVSESAVLMLGDSGNDQDDAQGAPTADGAPESRGDALVERILRTAAALRGRVQAAAMHRAVSVPHQPAGSVGRTLAGTATQLMTARSRVEALRRREESLEAALDVARTHDATSNARRAKTMAEFERLRNAVDSVDDRFENRRAMLESETAALRAQATERAAAASTKARALLAAHLKQVRSSETARVVSQLSGTQSVRDAHLRSARSHVDGLMSTWLCGLISEAASEMRLQLVSHGLRTASARQEMLDSRRDVAELAAAIQEARAQMQLQRPAPIVVHRRAVRSSPGQPVHPSLSLRGEQQQLLQQQPLHKAQLLLRSLESRSGGGADEGVHWWEQLVSEWDAAGVSQEERLSWLAALEMRRRFSCHLAELWRVLATAFGVAERLFAALKGTGTQVPPPTESAAPGSLPLPWESRESEHLDQSSRMTASQAASVLSNVLQLRGDAVVVANYSARDEGDPAAEGQDTEDERRHMLQRTLSALDSHVVGRGSVALGGEDEYPHTASSWARQPAQASGQNRLSPGSAATPPGANVVPDKAAAQTFPTSAEPPVRVPDRRSSSVLPATGVLPVSLRAPAGNAPQPRLVSGAPASAPPLPRAAYVPEQQREEDLADRLAAFVASRQQARQRAAAVHSLAERPIPVRRSGLRHRSPSPPRASRVVGATG